MKEFFRLYFIHRLFSSFQHKLHQSTNTYNDDGNSSRAGCSGCSDCDESFGCDIMVLACSSDI